MSQSKNSVEKTERQLDPSGFTTLKSAIGFSVLSLLAAVLVVPLMTDSSTPSSQQIASGASLEGNFDRTVTGSVSKPDKVKRYTVRKSVMQSDPTTPCIIYDNGALEGDC